MTCKLFYKHWKNKVMNIKRSIQINALLGSIMAFFPSKDSILET